MNIKRKKKIIKNEKITPVETFEKKITKFQKYVTSCYGYHSYLFEKKIIKNKNLSYIFYFFDNYGKIKLNEETGLKWSNQKKIAKLCKFSRLKKFIPYVNSLKFNY